MGIMKVSFLTVFSFPTVKLGAEAGARARSIKIGKIANFLKGLRFKSVKIKKLVYGRAHHLHLRSQR